MLVTESPGRSGLILGATMSRRKPPTIHAAITGPVPSRFSLIGFSNSTPTKTAGRNAMVSATSNERPSTLRPNSPWKTVRMRRR
jgi:hypothetical protein